MRRLYLAVLAAFSIMAIPAMSPAGCGNPTGQLMNGSGYRIDRNSTLVVYPYVRGEPDRGGYGNFEGPKQGFGDEERNNPLYNRDDNKEMEQGRRDDDD